MTIRDNIAPRNVAHYTDTDNDGDTMIPDTIPLNLIPVPEGWTYTLIEGLPLIERDVGNFNLSVGLDGGDWRWWLCPKGTGVADANGSADSQLDAIFAVLDALMGRL